MPRVWIVLTVASLAACTERPGAADSGGHRYQLGRPASTQEIAALDDAVGPGGEGLPPGGGSVTQGEVVYQQKCASCHGAKGEGRPPQGTALIGRDSAAEGFRFALDAKLTKTIGNYWPYATTVFDYIRRAMPLNAPGSLTNNEVYALTAYLLATNRVIPADARLDAQSLKLVKMPYANRFVVDDQRGGRETR